jgi:Rho-binding antiterminator
MYRYPVKLTMKSGKVVSGRALDTKRNSAGRECIELDVKEEKVLIEVDDVSTLEVSIENPHFSKINLDQ